MFKHFNTSDMLKCFSDIKAVFIFNKRSKYSSVCMDKLSIILSN